jgi:hypothetical protein
MKNFTKTLFFTLAFFCFQQMLLGEKRVNNSPVTMTDPSCGCPYTIAEQQEIREEAEEELILHADTAASFRGGEQGLKQYEERLIQNPAHNASDSTKYSILCKFIVERNGKTSHVELLNHSDKIFEEEAKRFIETMPTWNPARKGNKSIRSWHSLRLFFGYQKTN